MRLINYIRLNGKPVNPRSKKTIEVLNHHTVWEMRRPLLSLRARKLGYRFAPAEAAWMLTGSNLVSQIAPFAPKISQFSDDGVRFFGAYGPKIIDQLQYVVRKIVEDNCTRQAVINIWRESPPISKDIPCTTTLQFLQRGSEIHCVSTMRSNDAWLGTPYDIFNFSCIAMMVAASCTHQDGIERSLGRLYHNVGSHHLYETDLNKVRDVVTRPDDEIEVLDSFRLESFEFVSHPDHIPVWLKRVALGSNLLQLSWGWQICEAQRETDENGSTTQPG